MTTSPFRILSIDGGGMRGLYSAALLQGLARLFDDKWKTQEPDIGKSFDLICGTSTGAILACALASGVPLSVIQSLYKQKGASIFHASTPKKTGSLRFYLWCIKHLNKNSANQRVLADALRDTFQDETVSQIYERRQIKFCIPATNMATGKAVVFKTPHISGSNRDNTRLLADICLASASAPIIFPITKLPNPVIDNSDEFYTDGGLWANNPVFIALLEALLLTENDQPIEIISVGTCDMPSGDPNKSFQKLERGLREWKAGINIIEKSLSAQASGHSFMAMFLIQVLGKLGKQVTFLRLEESHKSPDSYSAIGLDTADNDAITTLLSFAQSDAVQNHSKAKAYSDSANEWKMLNSVFSSLPSLS